MSKITSLNGTKSKETIYVDVDDEITAIIEKVANARGTIIALVLPKRASVLQSVVNMKLLKRSADQAKKNLVLVTSEANLMPLAGLVGIHVADTATSKPMIPKAPDTPAEEDTVDEPLEVAGSPDFDPKAVAAKPVGELAGASAGASALRPEPEETLMMDDEAEEVEAKPDVTPVKRDRKLVVPNFDSFRLKLVLGVVALLLLGGAWYVASVVMPKAGINISTDSTTVTSDLNLTLDTAAKSLDLKNRIVPATSQTTQKTLTQQVPATGQLNTGEKASGSVVLNVTACAPNIGQPADVSAGTSVSSGGKTYITQESGSYAYNGTASGSCIKYKTGDIEITALKSGADYNLGSGASFSGPGGSTGTGSASGGTDVIVKVVAQSDIDSAREKLAAQDAESVKTDLSAALKGKGFLAIHSTFLAGEQQITASAKVGDKADNVTVSALAPYSMLGMKETDLRKLIDANVKDKIDEKRQKVLDDGIAKAKFSQESPGSASSAVVNVRVKTLAGPSLDVAAIKQSVAGKKAGEVESALKQTPGVTEVDVQYSPFWVTKVPTNTEKIFISIDGQLKD